MRQLVIATLAIGLVLPSAALASSLPIYPNAKLKPEHSDELRTAATENVRVLYLSASAYVSNDSPEKILNFYKDRMKSFGTVIQCTGGTNTEVDVRLDDVSVSNPERCDAQNVGVKGTQLKAVRDGDQCIVVVRPRADGSEFALVHVRAR